MNALFQTKALWVYGLAFVTIFSSCEKDPVKENRPNFQDKSLNIVLNEIYLSPSNVDSAFAKWEVNGKVKLVKLQVKSDTLFTKLSSFETGTGHLSIQIFSKNNLGNKSLQYERQSHITINNSDNIRISGPGGITDFNWSPRIIFKIRNEASQFNVTAIVGIRPEDSYFEFLNVDPSWRYRITLDRSYFRQGTPNTKLAGGMWDCLDNCIGAAGSYTNTTFFNFLAQQINNRYWDHVEFTLRLYNTPNNAGEMNFDYNF